MSLTTLRTPFVVQKSHGDLFLWNCLTKHLTFAWQGDTMLGKVDKKDTDEHARTRRLHQVRGLYSDKAYSLSSGIHLCSPKTRKEEQRNLYCSSFATRSADTCSSAREIGQNKDGLSRPFSVAKSPSHVWTTTDDDSSSRYPDSHDTLPCGNCQGSKGSVRRTHPMSQVSSISIPRYIRTHFHFLTPGEKWFYACLFDLCHDTDSCIMSLRQLRTQTGLSAITLSRGVETLQAAGLIQAYKKARPSGGSVVWNIALIPLTQSQAETLSKQYKSRLAQLKQERKAPELAKVVYQLTRAQQTGLPATLTLDEWLITLEDFKYLCAYCGGSYDVIEHFIPLVLGGGTTRFNCVPACNSCNTRKKDYHPHLMPFSIGMSEGVTKVADYLQHEKSEGDL